MVILWSRFNPNQNSTITKIGNRIINFITNNKRVLKRFTSIIISISTVISLIFIIGFYLHTLPKNRGAENYVNEYIKNSTEIELFYLEPDEIQTMRQESQENYTTETYERHSKIIQKYHKSQTIYTGLKSLGKRAKVRRVIFNTTIFKDENSQKYFQIMYAARTNEQMFTFSALLRDGTRLIANVNKTDIKNNVFGTIENPVPVLTFHIPKYERSEDYERARITEEQYRNNVYYYLSYIISKDEFRQRLRNSNSPPLLTAESNAQTDSTNIKTYHYSNSTVDSITIRHRDEARNRIVSRKKDWDLILEIASTAVYDKAIDEAIGNETEIDVPDYTFFIHCSNGQKHTIIFWGGLISIDGKWHEPDPSSSSTEFQEMGSRY